MLLLGIPNVPLDTVPDGDSEPMVGGNPLGVVLASVCFLIILAAIAGGIYFIVAGS